jgi:hypothetical protein
MDYANRIEAVKALWDVEEGRYGNGKTRIAYLDIIYEMKMR